MTSKVLQTTLLTIAGITELAELDTIVAAVKARRMALAPTVQPGATIKFADSIRPRYLAGLTAVVKRVNDKSVTIDCPDDARYGRFKGSHGVRLPNSLIAGVVA